ncbi:hypothetical protein [Paenibacillus turpanensis]|nr:hypothetical protein [Paenibacillus turpanensis]
MGKRSSKAYNEQQNRDEFAEEIVTLNAEKMKEYSPNVNKIPKNVTNP